VIATARKRWRKSAGVVSGFGSGAGLARLCARPKIIMCGESHSAGGLYSGAGRGATDRTDQAAELFKQGAAPRIIVTGTGGL